MGGREPLRSGSWRWNGREWVDTNRRARTIWPLLIAVIACLGLLALAAAMVGGRSSSPPRTPASPTSRPSAPTAAPPAAAAAAPKTPAQAPAPPSTAAVRSVGLQVNGACAVGGSCDLEVTVSFPTAGTAQLFSWTLQATDTCTGAVSEVGQGQVTAQAGWNHVIGDSTVSLPAARGPVAIVAVTAAPDRAASPPLRVGGGAC